MDELYEQAKIEYARLVALPLGGYERFYCRSSLAFLRDFIAVTEGRESEAVQLEYEEKYQPGGPPLSVGVLVDG